MNKLKLIVMGALALIITGCASPTFVTKAQEFPQMYNEKPRSLLVMPPINISTAADAKDYYATTVEMPLAFQGYYTFPYELTTEILKQEGIYDSELVYDMPLDKFHEYFGADAVLFTKIKKWDTSYAVVASSLTVSIDAEIKSTKTSETLWKYNGTVVVDLSGGNSSGSIVGLIAQAIVTAVNTAAADYTTYARQANGRFISTLPVGPYHPLYMQDQEVKVLKQYQQ